MLLLDAPGGEDASDVLHLVATTTVVAMALEAAPDERHHVAEALMLDLVDGSQVVDVLGRARRAGADLSRGAVAACVLDAGGYAHRVRAALLDAFPAALVLVRGQRVDALLPRADEAAALRLAARVHPLGALALSPFEPDPEMLGRALREAALAAALPATAADALEGTYRLLLRLASDHPAELARFHRATIGVIAEHDAEHGTSILETLVAYLDNDCNMNATAAAIYAHRHTIAYRLERVHELTGLDPLRREGRERLGLGLKTAALLRGLSSSTASRASQATPKATNRTDVTSSLTPAASSSVRLLVMMIRLPTLSPSTCAGSARTSQAAIGAASRPPTTSAPTQP